MKDALAGRHAIGAQGEAMAADHLVRAGYTILHRNLRTRYGEMDIVAQDGACLVFVEVRTRRSRTMTPEESVTAAKGRRLAGLGLRYLQDHGLEGAEWRIDVIAIEQDEQGNLLRLEHHQSAIEEPS